MDSALIWALRCFFHSAFKLDFNSFWTWIIWTTPASSLYRAPSSIGTNSTSFTVRIRFLPYFSSPSVSSPLFRFTKLERCDLLWGLEIDLWFEFVNDGFRSKMSGVQVLVIWIGCVCELFWWFGVCFISKLSWCVCTVSLCIQKSRCLWFEMLLGFMWWSLIVSELGNFWWMLFLRNFSKKGFLIFDYGAADLEQCFCGSWCSL
jgi:hypothetical protein